MKTSIDEKKRYHFFLDEIYASYMGVKELVKGKLDSETRNPWALVKLAHELGIVPDEKKIVRVTGSKGKGTATRLISWASLSSNKYDKVGSIISPEELDHFDRIRINSKPIAMADFNESYEFLRPYLNQLLIKERTSNSNFYLSPSGIFLLIGLKIFKDQFVDFFVLEGGRGAKFDELGQIPSTVSVITSLFLEHSESLGPTIEDVWKNKSFYFTNSKKVVLGPSCLPYLNKLDKVDYIKKSHLVTSSLEPRFPPWYSELKAISQGVSEYFSWGTDFSNAPHLSSSFGHFHWDGKNIFFDAVISIKSIDPAYLDTFLKANKIEMICLCLPDDKDFFEILNFIQSIGITYEWIKIEGVRGYLKFHNYDKSGLSFYQFDYASPDQLAAWIRQTSKQNILMWGTQTFLRYLKLAVQDQ